MTQVLSRPAACAQMDGPFGYAFFNDGRDEPAPPPEPPAPGKPLLSDSDTSLNNRLFSGLADPHLLESLTQYHTEPVPSLFGSSSHFGHPELDLSRTLGMFNQHNAAYNAGPMSAPAHASVFPDHQQHHHLLQQEQQQHLQQQQQQQHHHQQQQAFNFQIAQQMQMPQRAQASHNFVKPEAVMQGNKKNIGARGAFIRRGSVDYVNTPIPLGGDIYNITAREMLKEGRDARPDSYLERRMTFTYGSDTAFKGSVYNPPTPVRGAQKTTEANMANVVHNAYKTAARRATARSQIPTATSADQEPLLLEAFSEEGLTNEDEGNSRKRGREEDDEEDEENEDDDDEVVEEMGIILPYINRKKTKALTKPILTGSSQPPPRSPSTGRTQTPTSANGGGHGLTRKPSDVGAAKPSRVNLTEVEKKQNHIRSEQKRRNQIKEGFAGLTELMPDAASAGPSKCIILAKAVEWLGELIEGNRTLKGQLSQFPDAALSSA